MSSTEKISPYRHPIRKLYDWTLSWAETPYGVPALFVISFIESSFFPIPPDVLLLALTFGKPKKWMTFAFWCSVASVLGGVFGWFIGSVFWHAAGDFFFQYIPGFTQDRFDLVKKYYDDNAFFWIFIAAFTPIPYKVFTIASGVFGVSVWTLIGASVFGRSARFFMVAGIIRLFGDSAKKFIDKYFDIAAIVMVVMGVLGFLAIKWLMH